MARVIYSEKALDDLEHLTDFLLASDLAYAAQTVDLIFEAVTALKNHPYIGRAAGDGLCELVVSRGRTGYVALYSVEDDGETALILTIRHQREAGYSDPPT